MPPARHPHVTCLHPPAQFRHILRICDHVTYHTYIHIYSYICTSTCTRWLIAARSGPGHFAVYHERFGHEGTDSNCLCGQKRSQMHPFSCTCARKHRLHLWCNKRQRQLAPDEVLGTPEGVTVCAKWAPRNRAF